MRIRNRDLSKPPVAVGPLEIHQYTPPSTFVGTTNVDPATSLVAESGFETIEDLPGSVPEKVMRPVKHQRLKYSLFETDYVEDTSMPANTRYVYTGPGAAFYSWGYQGQLGFENLEATFDKDVHTLFRKALDELRHGAEADNLLNLVELHQLRDSVTSLQKRLKQASPTWQKKLSKASRLASGTWLGWAFGLAPLLMDIRATTAGIKKFKQAYKHYKRSLERPMSVHASCKGGLKISSYPEQGGGGNVGDGSSYWHGQVHYLKVPRRVVTIVGQRLGTKSESDYSDAITYFLRRYGSEGPASFLWERVPFSFVLDWFVDTSTVLESIDDLIVGEKARVLSACYSESYTAIVSAIHHPTATWLSSLDGQVVAQTELNHYIRQPTPPFPLGRWSGRFGKRQFVHSVALLREISASRRRR